MADLTLVPSRYVEATIREFYPYKDIAVAPYGVNLEFWTPGPINKPTGPLRFIFAGQVSLRKGVPLLIEAWSKAKLRDAELVLVGSWKLADSKRRSLPRGRQVVSSVLSAGSARSVSGVPCVRVSFLC